MNYENILSEDAAQQFREEGATAAIITLYNKTTDKVIRDVEVQLTENRYFAVTGKTPAAVAAIAAHFVGHEVDGEVWFPFDTLYRFTENKDRLMAEIAAAAGVNCSDLKWSFINER